MLKKVLVVLSAAKFLQLEDDKTYETGYYLNEFYEPLKILIDNNYDFDIATPNGNSPSLDRYSLKLIRGKLKKDALEFIENNDKVILPKSLEDLCEEKLINYCGLLIPGGHGPLVDLAVDENMARIIKHFHKHNKTIGAICHGPAAFFSLKESDYNLFKGYTITCFPKTAEKIGEKIIIKGKLMNYIDDLLKHQGFIIENSKLPMQPYVVVDRELVTGQDPTSSKKFGKAFLKEIEKQFD